jgi:epoxyqueuosine reductase
LSETPSVNKSDIKKNLLAYAHSLGFEKVGVTSAAALPQAEAFLAAWLSEGRAGEMAYLEREPARRARPASQLPEAKSVIALAMGYNPGVPVESRPANEGKISRYAWGADYHRIIGKRLDALVRYLEALAPESESRTFVDTGPLLERAFAQRAGLGFIGKNTMLITKGLGSWVFLASVVTTLELPVDAPDERNCGQCRLCIDACPTEAITAAYELDARRCISYLTIEQRGVISKDLRAKTDGWVYGCDICQDVCPHNTRAPVSKEPGFQAEAPMFGLRELLGLRDEGEFKKLFTGTAMLRAGWRGMVRNACVAAGNLRRHDLLPELKNWSSHEDPIIREHAQWALEQIQKPT